VALLGIDIMAAGASIATATITAATSAATESAAKAAKESAAKAAEESAASEAKGSANMGKMFWDLKAFNKPLIFDTPSVTDMSHMFLNAKPLTFPKVTRNVATALIGTAPGGGDGGVGRGVGGGGGGGGGGGHPIMETE